MRSRDSTATTGHRSRPAGAGRRAPARLALGFCLFCLAGQAAAGGWLVVATTSPSVPAGTLVDDPADLVVEKGASVTLLGEDGRLVTRRHEKAKVEQEVRRPGAAERLAGALRTLLAGGETGTRIGAVRGAGDAFGVSGTACRRPAASLDELARTGCREELADRLSRLLSAELARDLYLYAAGRERPRYRFGEPIDLHAVANFDADLFCWVEQDGVIERLLPRRDGEPPRLRPSHPRALFPEKGPKPVAAPPPGRSRVRCLGLDPASARKVRSLLAGSSAGAEELRRLTHAWLAGTLAGAAADITIEVAEAAVEKIP